MKSYLRKCIKNLSAFKNTRPIYIFIKTYSFDLRGINFSARLIEKDSATSTFSALILQMSTLSKTFHSVGYTVYSV